MEILSSKDVEKYTELVDKGREGQAVNMFIDSYVIPASRAYSSDLSKYLLSAQNAILSGRKTDYLTIKISSSTSAFKKDFNTMFKEFESILSRGVFKRVGITSPPVKSAIRDNTVKIFMEKIEGALSQTNANVLSSIRKLQVDFIKASQRIDRMVEVGELLKKDVSIFKSRLISDLTGQGSDFFKMVGEDKFIKYSNGSLHRLDDYADMATRTTVLNVERNAIEIKEAIKNRLVAEYYLRDNRGVKEERVICKSIMSRKFYGKSIVAFSQRVADILGCVYLESAKAAGAFGPYCRHSVRDVGDVYHNRIEQIVFISDSELGAA